MKNFCELLTHTLVLIVTLGIIGCSGGGGGGGGSGGLKRSTSTGVRIVHAALDASPQSMFIGDQLIQSAGYSELTNYVKVPEGDSTLTFVRANLPGDTTRLVAATFAKNTEYTAFIYGSLGDGNFKIPGAKI